MKLRTPQVDDWIAVRFTRAVRSRPYIGLVTGADGDKVTILDADGNKVWLNLAQAESIKWIGKE